MCCASLAKYCAVSVLTFGAARRGSRRRRPRAGPLRSSAADAGPRRWSAGCPSHTRKRLVGLPAGLPDQDREPRGVRQLLGEELLGRLCARRREERPSRRVRRDGAVFQVEQVVEHRHVGLGDRRLAFQLGLQRIMVAASGEHERTAGERPSTRAEKPPSIGIPAHPARPTPAARPGAWLTTRRWIPGSRSPRVAGCRSPTRGTSTRRRRR